RTPTTASGSTRRPRIRRPTRSCKRRWPRCGADGQGTLYSALVTERFDVAIVGGGMGGYPAAIRAAQLGLRAALVEEDKVGGTCLHRGCIPTKALLQTASLLDQLQHASAFGINAAVSGVDMDVAGARRDQVVSQLHRGVE